MNLHEFQAKQLFAQYQLPVPQGGVAYNLDEALQVAASLSTPKWVVKAQVHAGGRGKAGGVKIVSTKEALTEAVKALLGQRLVTYQTDAAGQPIHSLLIEETCDIDRELYLGAVVDRASRRVVMMLSTEGGVEIEKVAEETPDKIFKCVIDPLLGVMPYQCRALGFQLQLSDDQVKQLTFIMEALGRLFVDYDLSLLEVNPLVVNKAGKLICLDGKINVDGNALYRQPLLKSMRDTTQEDASENRASNWESMVQGLLWPPWT
jgi:succinyl-CoA synthetase beta subunit